MGGFGFLGLLVVELLLVISEATQPPQPQDGLEVFSPGEVFVLAGFAAFVVGAMFGLFVWVIWRVWCWLTHREDSGSAASSSF